MLVREAERTLLPNCSGKVFGEIHWHTYSPTSSASLRVSWAFVRCRLRPDWRSTTSSVKRQKPLFRAASIDQQRHAFNCFIYRLYTIQKTLLCKFTKVGWQYSWLCGSVSLISLARVFARTRVDSSCQIANASAEQPLTLCVDCMVYKL